tara:strand:+ start:126 stop:1076 length:951 start_codon:yes stop_codon:yes gene_type:complete
MSNSPYIVRNYQPEDFDKLLMLKAEAEKLEPTGRAVLSQVITENLGRPNYSPGKDLFLVEMAGKSVGYLDMAPELAIGRVILDCWVHPEYRKRGLATTLLAYALVRAKELGAKVAHVNVMEDDVAGGKILSRLGFSCVRRFLELRLEIAMVRWLNAGQSSIMHQHLKRGDEEALVRIQNRSFGGTWGYNPNSVEEIIYKTNLSNHSPKDVVLTYDGDEVVGYCWAEITNQDETAEDQRKGRVYMMGTDPDYRGKGVGKKVLLAGLAHLKNRGAAIAELTVDSQNKVASALYESIGFKIQASSLWYEKTIDQGAGAR